MFSPRHHESAEGPVFGVRMIRLGDSRRRQLSWRASQSASSKSEAHVEGLSRVVRLANGIAGESQLRFEFGYGVSNQRSENQTVEIAY